MKRLAGLVFSGWLCMAVFSGAPVLRILPLGDSITNGEGATVTVLNSYRKTLKLLLAADGYVIDYVGGLESGDFPDNQHHGHNGWYADHDTNTNTILSHISGWMSETEPDIILLHIGTNDILGGNEDADEVSLILDQIYAANSNATVVLALIVATPDDFPLRTEISAYNIALNSMAQNRILGGDDLLVVDMEFGAGIDYESSDMGDTLHPSPVGYDKMATNWYPATVTAIERQFSKRQPVISFIEVGATTILFGAQDLYGPTVYVEAVESLLSNDWNTAATFYPVSSETNFSLPYAGQSNRFFRLSYP